MKNKSMVFLNTWGAYNNGCIGYGWMYPDIAREYIENNPDRDGGEWFIADIDNYTGFKFSDLDYCDVMEVIDTLEILNDMDEWERDIVVAIAEYRCCEVKEAIDNLDNYITYSDIDEYYNSCDELIECEIDNSILSRYFDYNSYHRDCSYDIYEASNGVCILAS